jgi:hypothetical protein
VLSTGSLGSVTWVAAAAAGAGSAGAAGLASHSVLPKVVTAATKMMLVQSQKMSR